MKRFSFNLGVLMVALAVCLPLVGMEAYHEHVKRVQEELTVKEGVGDRVTNVPTGSYGVTPWARIAVGATPDMDDPLVALKYLEHLDNRWHKVRGYTESPQEVKEALLDSSYNLGERIFTYQNLKHCLVWGDYLCVVENLLDTANVEGKSVKGLAVRRANAYNAVAKKDIMFVRQQADGTIDYATSEKIIFTYRPVGGKHEKSVAGFVLLRPDARGMF